MNKQELRKKYSFLRHYIENKEQKDEAIFEKLQTTSLAHDSIFCYVSLGSEVNTHKFIMRNTEKIYIPYTENGVMQCRKYLGGELNPDKLGNINPSSYGEVGYPTLTIVPMLAFDTSCYRLGYGGGYYDRYLSNAFTVKVGVAYDESLTTVQFNEIFDVPLDMIITPKNIYIR